MQDIASGGPWMKKTVTDPTEPYRAFTILHTVPLFLSMEILVPQLSKTVLWGTTLLSLLRTSFRIPFIFFLLMVVSLAF